MEADFSYEIDEDDIIIFSRLNTLERLYWLESIFELTIKTDNSKLKKIRNFFREDKKNNP
ncbi:MAG: hypothetical protein KDK36_01705 [Leptospiraceae bacterium]|nr:hypothetical protein [Leptospiraceae bacterium]